LTLIPAAGAEGVRFTPLEQNVLGVLWDARGASVPAKQLIEKVWADRPVSGRTLRVHVSRLRGKLGHLGLRIERTGGDGYRVTFEATKQ
jgi:DNA-binding response OmpR family regulator